MCFDFADEIGCGENELMTLLMFAFLFVVALSLILYFLDTKFNLLNFKTLDTKRDRNTYEMMEFGSKNSKIEQVKNREMGKVLESGILLIKLLHLSGLKQMCRSVHCMIRNSFLDNRVVNSRTDDIATNENEFLFWVFGTFQTTMSIVDSVQNGFFFRLKNYINKKIPLIEISARNKCFDGLFRVASYLVMVLVYYLDLVKDILFLVILYDFIDDSPEDLTTRSYLVPVIFFCAAAAFIALGEFANVLVALFEPLSRGNKLFGCFLFPLIPAVIMYKMMWLEFQSFCMAKRGKDI